MKLFDFAFCYGYDRKIQMLSGMCPEKWSFGGQSDNVILKNYIEHTFSKVEEEDNMRTIVEVLENLKDGYTGLYLYDKELGRRE